MKNLNKESKTFAFKLAEKADKSQANTKWQAKDSVSVAGCSGPWARATDRFRPGGSDNGMYC